MKKSLLITLDWPPSRGGVANYLWNIYSRLPRDFGVILTNIDVPSAEPTHLKKSPPGFPAESSGDGLILAPLGGDSGAEKGPKTYRRELLGSLWPKWLRAYFEAIKIVRAEKIEAVHLSHILPVGYIAWMFKKVYGIPYVVYLHGMDIMLAQKSPWKKIWAKNILRNADLIIANSKFTAGEAVKAGAQNKKIEILYPCPNIVPSGEDAPAEKNIILSVGRLVPRKGFDKVIEAMPEILRAGPNVEYQIVGDGPYATELKQSAEKLGVGGQVKFFHNISDADLPEFYKNCKMFAMPAREIRGDVEGFGIVYLEAASFGKPSIAGNTGGAPEAVLNNQTGLTVNPESRAEIADAIIKLLKDENLRANLGKAARERVLTEFTWEKQINKIINKF